MSRRAARVPALGNSCPLVRFTVKYSDKEISRVVMGQMLAAGRYIGMLNADRPLARRTKFKVDPKTRRAFEAIGLGRDLRMLQKIATGKDPKIVMRVRCQRALDSLFMSVRRGLDPALVGRIVSDLLDTAYLAEVLAKRLEEVAGVKGRTRRAQLRSILLGIWAVELSALQRHVDTLRRDIPRLLKHLDPAKSRRGG